MSSDRAIVLTRPEPANSEFAHELIKRKIQSRIITLPLAEYVATNETLPDLTSYDAAIVTSRAALRFFDYGKVERPWIVVGGQSADVLRENGQNVVAEFATVKELASELAHIGFRKAIYFRGQSVQFDLARCANDIERTVDELIVYGLRDIEKLDAAHLEALENAQVLVFPVFSKESYLRLLRHWNTFSDFQKIYLLPISSRLYDFVLNNPPSEVNNGAVLKPPKEPTRALFLSRIGELTL